MTVRVAATGLISATLFALGMVAALASVDPGARIAGCLGMVTGLAGLVTVGLRWGSRPVRPGRGARLVGPDPR